jgi:flagellar secretion chaperone FliS
MATYTAASPAAYKQQSILTAPPGVLVVMLYDGANRFLLQAAAAMREEAHSQADQRLQRAEAIIDELLGTLNLEAGGRIASHLQGIYVFCKRRLAEARVARDPAIVEWVAGQMAELRQSFAQIAVER